MHRLSKNFLQLSRDFISFAHTNTAGWEFVYNIFLSPKTQRTRPQDLIRRQDMCVQLYKNKNNNITLIGLIYVWHVSRSAAKTPPQINRDFRTASLKTANKTFGGEAYPSLKQQCRARPV